MPFTLKTKRKKRPPIKRNPRRVKEYRSLKDVLKNLDIKKYSQMYENECLVGKEKSVRKSSENVRKSYSEKEMPTDDEKKLALEVSNKGRNISCKCLKKNSKLFKITPNQQQQQQQQQQKQQRQQQLQQQQLLLQRQLLQRQLQQQQQQLLLQQQQLQQQQRRQLRPQKHPSVKFLFPVYPEFSCDDLPFKRRYGFQESTTSSDIFNEYSNPHNEYRLADKESASVNDGSAIVDNESATVDCECANADNNYANVDNERANVIFVSLDFLNDCHKHKKKTNRSPVQDKKSKYSRKSMRNASGHRNRFPHKIPKIKRFQKYCDKKKDCDKALTSNKRRERRGSPQKTPDANKKSREATTTTKETDSSFVCLDDPTTCLNKPSEYSLDLWPCFQKKTSSPEEDVSKINKKYLQALLLSCRREEPKSKQQSKREDSRQASRTHDKKKKRVVKANNSKTIKCKKSIEKDQKSRCECGSPNCVVDTDSSEIQNPSLGVKNKFLGMKIPQVLAKYDTPKTKSKKTCPEKRETKCKKKINPSEIKDTKKNNRKEETKAMRNDDKPCFLEGEVKEIWVRDMGKESTSSITSQISSAMAVNEELYNSYNMGIQSYSKLKKIVESEIARISKNSVAEKEKNHKKPEEKKPTELKTERKQKKMPSPSSFFVKLPKEPKSEGDGERMPDKRGRFPRTYTNQIVIPITKTFSEMFAGNGEDLDFVIKKRMHQAERQKQINCNQELREAKEKSASHNHFHEGVFENIKSKLRTLGEGKNVNENIPGEIIKNWSILHRLEKAFLALGTPNFQNKKRKDINVPQLPLKSTNGPNESGSDNKSEARKNKPESCQPESEIKRRPYVGDGHKSKTAPKVSTAAEKEKLDQISRKCKSTSRREAKANELSTPVCCASPNSLEESLKKANAHEVLGKKMESSLKRSPTRGRPQTVSHKHRKETEPVNQKADLGPVNVREREENNVKLKKAKTPNSHQTSGADPVGTRPPKPKPPRKPDDQDLKPVSDGGKKSKLKFKLITNDVVSPKKFSRLQSRKLSKKKLSICSEYNSTDLPNVENVVRPKSIGMLSENRLEQVPPEKSKSNDKAEENSDAFDSKDFLPNSDCKGFLNNLSSNSMNVWKMFDEKETFQLETFENKFKSSETIQVNHVQELALTTPKKDVSKKKIVAPTEKAGRPDGEKENVDSSKGKMTQEKKSEKPISADVPQKMVRAWKELNNYWCDREVKERSILSMRGNQPTTQVLFKKFNPIKMKPPHNLEGSLKSPTPAISVRKNQSHSRADIRKISSNTCNADFLTVKKTPLKSQINFQKEYKQDYPLESSVSVLSSENCNPVPSEVEDVECEEKRSKAQAQWEQDINCYRTIVKDIINQYKRTDGFLKHREGLRGPEQYNESLECLTGIGAKSKSKSFVENPEDVDIQEYRKKIVSEYEAVPIFEYNSLKGRKAKMEKTKTKRKLPVNKVNTEMDLDVKDYQPNVQKVLGSQIYVDVENANNRKPKEKHSSLQKVFCKNIEKITEQDELLDTYQRTSSLPRAFGPLPPSPNNLGAI